MEFSEIIDEEMRQSLRERGFYCDEAKIQVAVKSPAVWFLGSNAETVNLDALNFCIKNHPNFVNLPVYCDIEHLRAHYYDPWKRKDD